jgi:hypothetical protein
LCLRSASAWLVLRGGLLPCCCNRKRKHNSHWTYLHSFGSSKLLGNQRQDWPFFHGQSIRVAN